MVKILNPLKMNNWGIKNFLITVISFQLIFFTVVAIESIYHLNIQIIRELISFINLILIPGFLILRIFKIHELENVMNSLCAIGLSITSLMFLGLFMNLFLPYFGILKVFSAFNIIMAFTIFISFLIIMAVLIDRNYSNPDYFELDYILNNQFLFLFILPFIAIVGTYIMNWYGKNILLILLLILIGLVVFLVAIGKIRKVYYPMAIFVMSISVLFHTSLISQFITGWDVNAEYYLASIVLKNSFWQYNTYNDVNSMLSVVIFAPLFQKVSTMGLDWIFKIIYPFILALTPVALYEIYKNQTKEKIAFLAAFIFLSLSVFYTGLISIAREEICEFFIALFLLILFTDKIKEYQKSILIILFTTSIVVSHYGLSYILLFFVIFALSISFIIGIVRKSENKLFKRFKNSNLVLNITNVKLSITFALFFAVMALAWYMTFSGSSSFDTLVHIFDRVFGNIYNDFFDPSTAHGMAVLTAEQTSILHKINKYLHLITQFFIIVGFLSVLKKNIYKFSNDYLLFSLSSLIFLIMAIGLPYFANWINTWRLYQFVLIFLAPFAVIGIIYLINILPKLKIPLKISKKNTIILISLFLVISFFFDSSLIYQISNDDSNSIALNSTYETAKFNVFEVTSINWLDDNRGNGTMYVDSYRSSLFAKYFESNQFIIPENVTRLRPNSYIYYGSQNVAMDGFLANIKFTLIKERAYVNMSSYLSKRNIIYDNNYSTIYY